MKVKCDYCGQMVDENLKTCPNCGGPMSTANRVSSGQPKTIEELKKWYTDHNLPPEETTRFFIGKDIKEPKAFGIYKDQNGDFVVYKNKSDGDNQKKCIFAPLIPERWTKSKYETNLSSDCLESKTEHAAFQYIVKKRSLNLQKSPRFATVSWICGLR